MNILNLSILYFFNRITDHIFNYGLPIYVYSKTGSFKMAGGVFALEKIVKLGGQPLFGAIADYFKENNIILILSLLKFLSVVFLFISCVNQNWSLLAIAVPFVAVFTAYITLSIEGLNTYQTKESALKNSFSIHKAESLSYLLATLVILIGFYFNFTDLMIFILFPLTLALLFFSYNKFPKLNKRDSKENKGKAIFHLFKSGFKECFTNREIREVTFFSMGLNFSSGFLTTQLYTLLGHGEKVNIVYPLVIFISAIFSLLIAKYLTKIKVTGNKSALLFNYAIIFSCITLMLTYLDLAAYLYILFVLGFLVLNLQLRSFTHLHLNNISNASTIGWRILLSRFSLILAGLGGLIFSSAISYANFVRFYSLGLTILIFIYAFYLKVKKTL